MLDGIAVEGPVDADASRFGRIVVAVDRSDPDMSAVRFAASLCTGSDTAVLVVHVREQELYSRPFVLETDGEAWTLVAAGVERLHRRGIPARGVVTLAWVGAVSQAIVGAATAFGAEAIVIGSAGPRRLFGRRTRERLLRASPVPVLVPPGYLACHATRAQRGPHPSGR